MTKSVMVDLETLSTRSDAVILSIGAVKFDLERGKIYDSGFYTSISIDSNTEAGRHISEDTLVWWMGQGDAARRVFSESKVVLPAALEQFSDWIGNDDGGEVWSNGADFDIPMLAHAFSTHDMTIPWKFYNTRCFRTYKKLPGAPACKTPPTVAHHALHDAISQAQHAIDIYAHLFGNKPTVPQERDPHA